MTKKRKYSFTYADNTPEEEEEARKQFALTMFEIIDKQIRDKKFYN